MIDVLWEGFVVEWLEIVGGEIYEYWLSLFGFEFLRVELMCGFVIYECYLNVWFLIYGCCVFGLMFVLLSVFVGFGFIGVLYVMFDDGWFFEGMVVKIDWESGID